MIFVLHISKTVNCIKESLTCEKLHTAFQGHVTKFQIFLITRFGVMPKNVTADYFVEYLRNCALYQKMSNL